MIEAFEIGVSLGLDTGDAESALSGLAGNLANFDKMLAEVKSRFESVQLASTGLGASNPTEWKVPVFSGMLWPDGRPGDLGGIADGNGQEREEEPTDSFLTVQSYKLSGNDDILKAGSSVSQSRLWSGDLWAGQSPVDSDAGRRLPVADYDAEHTVRSPFTQGAFGTVEAWHSELSQSVASLQSFSQALAAFPRVDETGADKDASTEPTTSVGDGGRMSGGLESPQSAISTPRSEFEHSPFFAAGAFRGPDDFTLGGPASGAIGTQDANVAAMAWPNSSGGSDGSAISLNRVWTDVETAYLQSSLATLIPALASARAQTGTADHNSLQVAPPAFARSDGGGREVSGPRHRSEAPQSVSRTGEAGQAAKPIGQRAASDDDTVQSRPIVVHTNVQIDGDVVARAVSERMVAWMNGPLAGTGGFDPRRSYTPIES